MKPAESSGDSSGGSSGGSSDYQIGVSAKNPDNPGSENFFGGLDYDAAKAAGKSDREVLDFLNQNLDKLRRGNVPGGGGLYDQIASRVG